MFKLIYKITDKIKNKLNEKGQGMVEYAIVLAAVAAIAFAVIWNGGNSGSTEGLKGSVTKAFDNASDQINAASTGEKTPAEPKQ